LVGFIAKKEFLKEVSSAFRKVFGMILLHGPLVDEIYLKKRSHGYMCEVIDRFRFGVRFSPVFDNAFYRLVEKQLIHILEYKYEMLQTDCDLSKKYPYSKPLKLLISGATGFVGSSLRLFLESFGHDVWSLSRSRKDLDDKTIGWDFSFSQRGIKRFDAVIHLAGENIAKGWWTKRKKALILESRQKNTLKLVEALGNLQSIPHTLISASGVGVYGDCGDEILTEDSAQGTPLFLTKVCEFWEHAAHQIETKSVRVVCARFGMILSPRGGALKKILFALKVGMGGKIGSGMQYISWIAMDDVIGAFYHVLMTPHLAGPVNFTSPYPVRNRQFTRELAKATSHFSGLPIPSCMIRSLLGQKGKELLLSSTRAEPKKLLDSGYYFRFDRLREALQHLI